MKSLFLISIFILFLFNEGYSQGDCPCCSDDHKQFDFWLGDWDVYDSTGNMIGENLIVKLEDGCLINEHWKGKSGTTGRSYNYFDKSDSTWNQVWIDNKAGNLFLKGKASKNKMVLQSNFVQGIKVPYYANRITWTLNDDKSITQLWEIVDKDESVIQVVFKGIYIKKR